MPTSEIVSLLNRVANLSALNRQELMDLHYDWEVTFAKAILAEPPGTNARRRQVQTAYQGVIAILVERRRRDGRVLDSLGLELSSVNEFLRILGPPPAAVCEVGCGTGVLIEALLRKGYAATGFEVARECVDIGLARMRHTLSGIRPDMRCVDFLESPVEEGAFSAVFSNDVLEHIPPDEAGDFVRKVFSMLKPGGFFWLVTPNKWSGPGDATTIKHPLGTRPVGLHLREYSISELIPLLRTAGFARFAGRLPVRRGGRATQAKSPYVGLKVRLEPWIALLPPRPRKRLIGALRYSEIVAWKPA